MFRTSRSHTVLNSGVALGAFIAFWVTYPLGIGLIPLCGAGFIVLMIAAEISRYANFSCC